MSDDLTFGVRLDGSSSTLVSETKKARDEVEGLTDSTKNLSAAMQKSQADWDKTVEYITGLSKAEDDALAKSWALANGYKEVGGQMVKANGDIEQSMGSASHANAGMTRELIVLGHEAVSGNFSRMPGTMMVLAERSGFALSALAELNPVVLGITAAAAAGAVVWYEWANAAEAAAKRAAVAAKDAEKDAKDAWSGVHKTVDEQINELANKMSGVAGQLEAAQKKNRAVTGTTSSSVASDAGRDVLARKSELDADQRQMAQLKQLRDQANVTALAAAQKFDDEMAGIEQTAFAKQMAAWQKQEDILVKMGAAGAAQRKIHEATGAKYIEEESAREIALESKKSATILGNEEVFLAKSKAAAENAGKTAKQREDKRYAEEVARWNQRHDLAKTNQAYSTEAEEKFQQDRNNIEITHNKLSMDSEASVVNFRKMLRDGDYSDAMDMAAKLSAGMAQHSRAMFEVNKVASLASATIKGYHAIVNSYEDGTEWGGPVGGALEAGIAAVFVAAQIASIASTQFGGGASVSATSAGGGIPSSATTPGVPVSSPAAPTPGVAATAPQNVFLTIEGATTPDKPTFTYNQIVNELVPLLNKAGVNGVNINVRSTA